MYVVGVNGCPGGWLAVAFGLSAGEFAPRVHASFSELLASYPDAACIAVDIPIGLGEGAPRRCDIEVRRVLGPRRSSVFPAPDRRLINVSTYSEALSLSRSLYGKGISKQGFAIYPKVAEVDHVMTPQLQQRVIEVHPEVSFWAAAGYRPMSRPKKTPAGYEERRNLLSVVMGPVDIPARDDARRVTPPAGADDLLDALVAAWTAQRFAEARAGRLPPDPSTDSRGLLMEMVYLVVL